MKLFYRKKTVDNEQKAGGGFHLPLWSFLQQNIQIVFVIIFSLSVVCFAVSYFSGVNVKPLALTNNGFYAIL